VSPQYSPLDQEASTKKDKIVKGKIKISILIIKVVFQQQIDLLKQHLLIILLNERSLRIIIQLTPKLFVQFDDKRESRHSLHLFSLFFFIIDVVDVLLLLLLLLLLSCNILLLNNYKNNYVVASHNAA